MYEAAEGGKNQMCADTGQLPLRVDVQPVSTTVFQKEEEVHAQAQALHMLHL